MKIDLILPYVTTLDANWRILYEKASSNSNWQSSERFRSLGTLGFIFRSIAKNMPWINKVHLLVFSKSQIPSWLTSDESLVKVHLHDEFIPNKLIPVFNSCTIESYLWNLDDLSDFVIYTNDDIFAMKPMTEADFYTNGLPNLHFKKEDAHNSVYLSQSFKSFEMIAKEFSIDADKEPFVKQLHTMAPYTKDALYFVRDHFGDTICQHCTRFRNRNNVNQYIYGYYHYFSKSYTDIAISNKYVGLNNQGDDAVNAIDTTTESLLNINDTGFERGDWNKVSYKIREAMKEKFPEKCKYEK